MLPNSNSVHSLSSQHSHAVAKKNNAFKAAISHTNISPEKMTEEGMLEKPEMRVVCVHVRKGRQRKSL